MFKRSALVILAVLAITCTYYYPAECEKYDHSFRFKENETGIEVVGTFFCGDHDKKIERVFAVDKKTPSNKVTIEFVRGSNFQLNCDK